MYDSLTGLPTRFPLKMIGDEFTKRSDNRTKNERLTGPYCIYAVPLKVVHVFYYLNIEKSKM